MSGSTPSCDFLRWSRVGSPSISETNGRLANLASSSENHSLKTPRRRPIVIARRVTRVSGIHGPPGPRRPRRRPSSPPPPPRARPPFHPHAPASHRPVIRPGSTWISDCIRGLPSGISDGWAGPSPDSSDGHPKIYEEPGPGRSRPTEVGFEPSPDVSPFSIHPFRSVM